MINKKRMAIICSTDYISYPMGGMMSFILDVYTELSEIYEIDLWGVNAGNGNTATTSDNVRVNVKHFGNVKTKNKIIPNALRVIRDIHKNKARIEKENYDILYVHGIPLSFPLFNLGPKVVNHIHGMTNPLAMTPSKLARNSISINLYEKYRNYVVNKSDLVLLAADKIGREKFAKSQSLHSQDKIIQIPNFADPDLFQLRDRDWARDKLGLRKEGLVFLNTGRISLQKDPMLLIRSFFEYKRRASVESKLYIIGDGELYDPAKELIEELGMQSDIVMLGMLSRQDISLWLNACDAYLYTSHANGFPISLAEAANSGKVIVSTDVNGVHDLVIEEKTGYLSRSRVPTEYAKKIQSAETLIDRENISMSIIDNAKNTSKSMVMKKIIDSMSTV